MYSRGIYSDKGDEVISIPQNYSGSAFNEAQAIPCDICEMKESAEECEKEAKESYKASANESSGILSTIGGYLSGHKLLDGITQRIRNIGTEEILILAIGAFLFFSKEGDKECAIMLLLLLFVA